jgi:hypothetical protein
MKVMYNSKLIYSFYFDSRYTFFLFHKTCFAHLAPFFLDAIHTHLLLTLAILPIWLKYTTTSTHTILIHVIFRKMSLDLADENMHVRTLKQPF